MCYIHFGRFRYDQGPSYILGIGQRDARRVVAAAAAAADAGVMHASYPASSAAEGC